MRERWGFWLKRLPTADSDDCFGCGYVESATPHEVKLATNTLVQMVIPDARQNLVGDNAYDSDKLDSELRRYGIELLAPHRMNRKNTTPGPASPATVSPTLEG